MKLPGTVRARDLVGRTIVAVDFRPFRHERALGGEDLSPYTTDPVLILDNGREVRFVVCETEVGEYGVEIAISDRSPRLRVQ